MEHDFTTGFWNYEFNHRLLITRKEKGSWFYDLCNNLDIDVIAPNYTPSSQNRVTIFSNKALYCIP